MTQGLLGLTPRFQFLNFRLVSLCFCLLVFRHHVGHFLSGGGFVDLRPDKRYGNGS